MTRFCWSTNLRWRDKLGTCGQNTFRQRLKIPRSISRNNKFEIRQQSVRELTKNWVSKQRNAVEKKQQLLKDWTNKLQYNSLLETLTCFSKFLDIPETS